ncbi:MAG: GAF domain-containing protein, partial [Deltaproteobacteria bacterium]|nr:GAF domain-containing protein [Deltaproteobacteria bacterium]
IECDARSNSEIVVPLRDSSGAIVGVLDVDSAELDAFSDVDLEALERIVSMIYGS